MSLLLNTYAFNSHQDAPPDAPIPEGSQLMTLQEVLDKCNKLKAMGWTNVLVPQIKS